MSKIDGIIQSVDPNAINNWTHLDNWTLSDVEYCMKTYAEWYAKECLDQAAFNLIALLGRDVNPEVDLDSITNITLPEH